MRMRKNFRTKKIWPVFDLDPDLRFVSGFEFATEINISDPDLNPDSNPDPNPDPKPDRNKSEKGALYSG